MKKKKYPILEFDASKRAVIEPKKVIKKKNVPEYCVLCFFYEVIDNLHKNHKLKKVAYLKSELGHHAVYEVKFKEKKLIVFNPGVGAPLAVGLLEEIIALGCKKFIACGGAGVLDKNIALGHVIIPSAAVRDEGTSYHYLPPAREIEAPSKGVSAVKKILKKYGFPYVAGKVWTTDAFYRETPQKVILRKKEGCIAVEMESAAFFAVTKFRKVDFAQILYGGDDVSGKDWDHRGWDKHVSVREKLFWLAAEACLNL